MIKFILSFHGNTSPIVIHICSQDIFYVDLGQYCAAALRPRKGQVWVSCADTEAYSASEPTICDYRIVLSGTTSVYILCMSISYYKDALRAFQIQSRLA